MKYEPGGKWSNGARTIIIRSYATDKVWFSENQERKRLHRVNFSKMMNKEAFREII